MKILFVCEGNVNRSQTAAMYLKSLIPSIEVASAGTHVPPSREGKKLSTVPDGSIDVVKEIGLNMSNNLMHKLTPPMVEEVDIVIVMGEIVAGPLPAYLEHSKKLEKWDVPDPGYGHVSFEDARDMVIERVKKFAENLKRQHRA